MINVKRTKTSILSVAFKGILCNREGKRAQNEEIAEIHKKNKKYVPVTDDEKLIDVPEHWVWTRLGYVTENHGQTTPTETFSYIDVGTMDNVNQRLSKHENLVEAKDAPSRAKKIVEKGDVLYSTVRPYLHNICIVDKDFTKKPIASTAFCVMAANEKVLNNRFLFYWLLTAEFDRFSNGNPSKGTLYPAIGEKDLLNGVIPLPSLKEQKEIVEIIEDAFNALGQLDVAQSQYASDIEVLKSKLIDAAIRGKLTEQLPEDGTPEELHKQIQTEKDELIKAGKIKKEKPLAEIEEDEIPFDIPGNWCWCRLSDIGKTNIGLTYHPEDIVNDGTIVVRSSNIINGKMDYNDIVKVSCPIRDNQYLDNNDIVICTRNGSRELVGKCAVYEGASRTVAFGAFMAVFRTRFFKYVYYYLQTPVFRRYFSNDDTKQINQVTQNILKNALIPLPPIAEQERIVRILEQLLSFF